MGVLALGACGDPAGQAPAAQAPAVATDIAEGGSATAVPESLAFTAARVGGGTVNLGDYAGRPVLLWFWAPT